MSTSVYHAPRSTSIKPQRIGLHEVIHNRFTGRSYLVDAAPLALPAPAAPAEQPIFVYTALDRAHTRMCEMAGTDDHRDAFPILMQRFVEGLAQ